ncbi:MAG TPA: hypothetical protein VMR51_02115 [Patescibacteria group bacterium]|nr:hypothetical protein [Patescibacteria group bacterium]
MPPKKKLCGNKYSAKNKKYLLANSNDSARTEAKDFERLLNSIAEWFIDNPAVTWQRELMEASRNMCQQAYSY